MEGRADLIYIMSESTNSTIQDAYNRWAGFYDSNENKTRDTEALALREMLSGQKFVNCLEIGCGTGKNTVFLSEISKVLTAVDFSDEMLSKARSKNFPDHVTFKKADINDNWDFASGPYDLVTFSLVLEHIENLDRIFMKLKSITFKGSLVYIGELHPFKQYSGTRARFETEQGTEVLTCYNHNISDFISAAFTNDFTLESLKEYFDAHSEVPIPRILALNFKKS